MILRREQPADRPAVLALHDAAFAAGTDGRSGESRLVEMLVAEGSAVPELSLVALDAAEGGAGPTVIGHVLVSRGQAGGRPLLGLGPLGVLPDHQRRGVGSALVHAVLAAADALDEPAVVLLGEVAYYRRFGFVPAATLGLLAPDPAWGEHFQVRPLTAWDPGLAGPFRYAPAFDAL